MSREDDAKPLGNCEKINLNSEKMKPLDEAEGSVLSAPVTLRYGTHHAWLPGVMPSVLHMEKRPLSTLS